MNKKHILILILFSFVIKLSYLLFSYAIENSNRNVYSQYVNMMKRNDSGWYQIIATKGYSEIRNIDDIGYSYKEEYKQSEWAFFPFYPMLNKYTSIVFGADFDLSALIWSVFFSVISIIGVYWFCVLFFKNESLALFTTLLLYIFPFSFYFSTFYTEALFLAFIIFSFLSVHYNRYCILMLLLIPLTLLRPNGIIILIPLYIYHLEKSGCIEKYSFKWKKIFGIANIKQSLYFLSAPIAFSLFCLYQYKMTGFFFAFSIAQRGWYKEFMFPLFALFRRGDFATQFNSYFTIVVIVFAVLMRKKLSLSLNVYVFLSLILPLCAGSVTSMTRYVSVIFPLFLTVSPMIYNLKSKYAIVVAIVVLHFLSFYSWLIYHFISY